MSSLKEQQRQLLRIVQEDDNDDIEFLLKLGNEVNKKIKQQIRLIEEKKIDAEIAPIAIDCSYEEIELLLNAGCDVNRQEKDGSTLLHYASMDSRVDTMKLLLDRGANINVKDNGGETPLHFM
jgi:ankyrin repeat protein